jgi:superfamily II DNA or RNA helicase
MSPADDDFFAIGDAGLLRSRLSELKAECARLQRENKDLRQRLGLQTAELEPVEVRARDSIPRPSVGTLTRDSPATAKVALFRSLFRGRDDVFAVRWIGKDGKAGYSPAATKDWSRVDAKGRPARTFLPLTDDSLVAHFTGRKTVGVYPLMSDETCWFLATDFDKSSWQDDARVFLTVCKESGLVAALERSRSGRGGHVWIFFSEAIPAILARKLGAAVLTRAMERRHQLGLDSYDRFFPNQDTMPKGGFGNLIALPLQHAPRLEGNSVFLDINFAPFDDQWAFLSGLRRVTRPQVECVIAAAEKTGGVIGLRLALTDENEGEDPWVRPPSRRKRDTPIEEPLPCEVRLVRGDLVYVDKENLPSAMLNRLLRLAAFQNPEFYRAQAMRLSTFGKPRVVFCGEELKRHIGLPRGCFTEAVELLKEHGVTARVQDERFAGHRLDVTFCGELREEQATASDALLAHDDGVLAATTAFGKTVIAAHCIAERGVNTLVLVHRRQLLDQWRERLSVFLGIDPKAIGVIAGGKKSRTSALDIALLQSLSLRGEVPDFVGDYGHVVIDECHHLSAFSFEKVLRRVKARFILGLTATPIRKDGHHPIIFMQCGPIRFRVDARKHAATRPFDHIVIPCPTGFQTLPSDELTIQQLYAKLTSDERRNAQIVRDVLAAIADGRSPLVLTERKLHAEALAQALRGRVAHVVVLRGGQDAKIRAAAASELAAIPPDAPRAIIATGRYIGEGFDDSRLDTLFLALPISWQGTLQQYVGRLHRLHTGKTEVRVHDYIDGTVPMLSRMFDRRRRGYENVGYTIRDNNAPVLQNRSEPMNARPNASQQVILATDSPPFRGTISHPDPCDNL